jgi:hypothetical protein
MVEIGPGNGVGRHCAAQHPSRVFSPVRAFSVGLEPPSMTDAS